VAPNTMGDPPELDIALRRSKKAEPLDSISTRARRLHSKLTRRRETGATSRPQTQMTWRWARISTSSPDHPDTGGRSGTEHDG
jgi:hypothetical protein